MAKDDNDKEQDDFFGDDDDFGLPELDFESLDDDDDSSDSAEATSDKPAAEEPSKEEEEVSVEDDSFDTETLDGEDIPDQISDEELEAALKGDDITLDDTDSLDDVFDDADLENMFDDSDALEDTFDEVAAMSGSGPEPTPIEDVAVESTSEATMEDFYEEESFDDFEASGDDDTSGDDIPDSVFDSDELDEDEFAQFEKDLMETEDEATSDIGTFDSEEAEPTQSKGKFAKVVIIGLVIFASLGGIIWYFAPTGEEESQPVVAEKTTPPPAKKEEPEEQQPAANAENGTDTETGTGAGTETEQPSSQPSSTPQNNGPASGPQQVVQSNPGTVNSLTDRTGNFYIVIGSFLDGDMAMDYATELSNEGKSPSIIPPFGKAVTHRVAIAGYASLAESQQAVGGFKAEYGEDIWILKY